MSNLTIVAVLSWLLSAFFTVGAILNLILPEPMRKDYIRWGYPGWFHYMTAALELAAAGLLFFPSSRLFGSILGAAIMVAAAATTLINREYQHAIAPSVVLFLTGTLGWLVAFGG